MDRGYPTEYDTFHYHDWRHAFTARPKWWGSKPWHRKPRPAQQRDEKVIAKVPAGKWGKDDLSR